FPHGLSEFDHLAIGEGLHEHRDLIERIAIELLLKLSQADVRSSVHRSLMMIPHIECTPTNVTGCVLPNRTCSIALRTIAVDQRPSIHLSQRRRSFRKINLSHFTLHQLDCTPSK